MNTVDAYPLSWPEGRERTPEWRRKHDQFRVTIAQAVGHLTKELERIRAQNVVISSNHPVRKDGLPMCVQAAVGDPGVAVYFVVDGVRRCMSCDQYHAVRGNVRAIGKSVEALRELERWGAKATLDRALEGFVALPAGSTAGDAWWDVLGVAPDASRVTIEAAFRRLVRVHHPDLGGDEARMQRVSAAYDEAIRK